METKPFILCAGIHNGTIMSRDYCDEKPVNSIEEAEKELFKMRDWFASMGYTIWFANVRDAETREIVHRFPGNGNYRR
jgi:hypothetical protein